MSMSYVRTILLVLAFGCFLLNALGISTWRGDRFTLLSMGLALWVLAVLLPSG